MEKPKLSAKRRQATGSRVMRRLRRAGDVPGIVYGKSNDPISVSVSRKELTKLLRDRQGEHGLVTLTIDADGETKTKAWEKPVLIKQFQRDPVMGEITHIDFHAIALTEHIRIKIPVELKGTSVGVKQQGGVLEHFLREIEIDCLPTQIPKQIEFDITNLNIGDAVHVRDLQTPEGSRITSDPAGVIASVLAPKAEKVEEPTDAVTEPEVIREKKPDAEGEAAEAKDEKKEDKKAEKKAEKKEEKK